MRFSHRALPRAVAAGLAAVLVLGAMQPHVARAGDALVAVAANFSDVVVELVPAFETATGHTLKVSTGSTGKIYAQIRNGAPFDLFLAADQRRPQMLEEEGAAVPGSRFTYASGRLTLWSADADRIGADGVAALRAADLRHLAIANPELAPYGQAARETLSSLGLREELSGRIVMSENIGQTFAAVASGSAELGFVALSAVVGSSNPVKGSRWDVPSDHHGPIRQDAVLLEHGRGNPAASAFLEFLRSPSARQVIVRHGYGLD